MNMDIKELKALISLLDDSDDEIVNIASSNILNQGSAAIPELEKAWETTLNETLQVRLESVIQSIQFNEAKQNLKKWKDSGAENILEGATYLAKFQFPDITLESVEKEIDIIKQDVWLELNNNLTALEKIKIINYIIFEIHKFGRNSTNFYSPQNSYINQVLETKRGNPISLAIIYLAVANKLNIPIYGVNLPKNFILAYKDEYRQYDSDDETEDILFYINPYNKGAVLGKKEIDYFIQQQQLEAKREYFIPCTNKDILIRLINNLILSYRKLQFTDKIEKLNELLGIL
ncbi:MAG: transglutaminase family protein [Bacteroidales bacterium]|nr:transglutaminase family protein [Bacteroidales bacterium]